MPDLRRAAPPFLDRLGPEDVERLRARLQPAHYDAGAQLIAADDPGDEMFVILEGRVEVSLFSVDGREVSYRDAGPGELIGELAVIDGAPRAACVTARGPVTAGRLNRGDLSALLAASPEFAMALLRHLTQMIRDTTDRVFQVSTLVVRERLLRELLRRAREAAAGGDAALIAPAPTHYELATRVSTHREAVSREMSRLAREGLVRRAGRALEVPSVARLTEALDVGE